VGTDSSGTLQTLLVDAAQQGIDEVSRAHHGPAADGASFDDDEEPNHVVEHLLLHRSLADPDPDRLAEYVEMARSDVASFRNPFDRAIALTFHLAADQHMDPWSIDLANFSTLYLDRIKDTPEVDLITGGRLLAMAWNVLLQQTEGLLDRAQEDEEPEEPEEEPWDVGWDEMPEDWGAEPDPDETYTEEVLDEDNDPPLSESVFRQGDRKVTLFELVEALEEGRRSAERRKRLQEERRKAREEAQAQADDEEETVEEEVHEEDLEAEIDHVRERLKGYEEEVDIREVFDGTREDYLTVFVSTLFLSKAEMVDVRQESFPEGPIYLEPRERLLDPDAAIAEVPDQDPADPEEVDDDELEAEATN
jgi:chromatin segregation and condensation protein Rec8/ScpA/Scc1 (kleisin family)